MKTYTRIQASSTTAIDFPKTIASDRTLVGLLPVAIGAAGRFWRAAEFSLFEMAVDALQAGRFQVHRVLKHFAFAVQHNTLHRDSFCNVFFVALHAKFFELRVVMAVCASRWGKFHGHAFHRDLVRNVARPAIQLLFDQMRVVHKRTITIRA